MTAKKIVLSGSVIAVLASAAFGANPNYSTAQIYKQMCTKCHGKAAEGNPKKKGPALNDKSIEELELDIIDIQNGGLSQSSGTEHDVMEHNQKKIEKKGMSYHPKDMAMYIYYSFNPEAKNGNPAVKHTTATKTLKLSSSEIYRRMCSKCHGMEAEGNPEKKGPALNDKTKNELEIDLIDIQSGGLSQSSGTEHDVMEHNQEKIIEKGMDYNPEDMATYIYYNFNKDLKK